MTAFTVGSGLARLAAETHGDGAPVVFLHAGVCDRRMWRHQMEAIGRTHRAIAYDRRGFGETLPVDEAHSLVGDLLSVLDALAGGAPAVLVGCSQGGRIAIDAALAHPQRVAGLVLIASALTGAPAATYPAAIQALLDELNAAEAQGDLDRVNALEAHLWLDGPLQPAGRVGRAARELFLDMNGIALRAEAGGTEQPAPSANDRLAEIAAPALVAWGDLDFPHLQARGRRKAELIPGAEALILPGAAHLPSLEQPERTTALISGFLGAVMPQAARAP